MVDPVIGPSVRTVQPLQAGMPPAQRTRILEGAQQERESATLLSALPGAGQTPFAAPGLLATVTGAGPFPAPRAGPGAYSTSGARERLNVALLETMQAGRETSALLSTARQPLPRPGRAVADAGSPLAQFAAGEEITAALASTPPSPASLRVATEAYQMELDAQRELDRQASGAPGRWEWFA